MEHKFLAMRKYLERNLMFEKQQEMLKYKSEFIQCEDYK